MIIKDLKDLKKLIQLCRQQGIQVIKVDGIELALNDIAPTMQRRAAKDSKAFPDLPLEANAKITTDELTEEQLLFGSSDPSVWNQQ